MKRIVVVASSPSSVRPAEGRWRCDRRFADRPASFQGKARVPHGSCGVLQGFAVWSPPAETYPNSIPARFQGFASEAHLCGKTHTKRTSRPQFLENSGRPGTSLEPLPPDRFHCPSPPGMKSSFPGTAARVFSCFPIAARRHVAVVEKLHLGQFVGSVALSP